MRIGLVCTAYECADLFDRVFAPWFEIKKELDIKIATIHCCFAENQEMGLPAKSKDGSHLLFQNQRENGNIDFHYFSPDPLVESEARNFGLKYLLDNECQYILNLGVDEIYTTDEIISIFNFVEKEKFIAWFSIEFKNLTFTENQYTKGFSPPRVFKTMHRDNKISHFYYDDDILYRSLNFMNVSYKNLPSLKIPTTIANPLHYTWLNNERSKQKVKYQEKHFGHYAGCGFSWNDEKNCLEFNKKYYEIVKQPIPQVFTT